jgi:D-alanyl-lipoteichoic acid acyltransferase DltB (MBOAT superfamily)
VSDATLDLIGWEFWVALALGILILTPLRHAGARRLCWAAVNVIFLWVVLHLDVLFIAAGFLVIYGLLQVTARWRHWLPVAVAGAGVLFLFLVHKLPGFSVTSSTTTLNPILATVSFSYVALRIIDVFRAVAAGRHPAPSMLQTINYLVPFHMLPAGPIQAYDDFQTDQTVPAPLTRRAALEGCERIVFGLFKKYVLAYLLERAFLTGFRSDGWYFLLEMQVFYLWLFLDFTAYSDIAVGAGRLMGVATPENFNRPFLARNIINFWERWHISLSQFIRRSIFIPLQLALMRRTEGRFPLAAASFAFAVSFVLCGLWHDVSLAFLAWGAFHALGLIGCNLYSAFLQKRLRRKGVKRYLASGKVRWASTFLTYQWVAFSLVLIAYPWNSS